MFTNYVDQFLKYVSAPDIIGTVAPINKMSKEISEAMGIIKYVKRIMIPDKMEWTLIDLCSGNALVPVISAFTLPSAQNYAIDVRPRKRKWEQVRRFQYITMDIYDQGTVDMIAQAGEKVILTSVHACKNLSRQAIRIFNYVPAKHLIIMPCCIGKLSDINVCDTIRGRVGKDILWGLELLGEIKTGSKKLHLDKKVLSPRNLVITASK